MNTFYNEEAARSQLNSCMARCSQETENGIFLGNLDIENTAVHFFEQPKAYRLTRLVDGSMEEVVVKVPGILCGFMLPPIRRPIVPNKYKVARKLKQSVRVTGLGCPAFNDLQTVFDNTADLFRAALGEGHTIPTDPALYDGEYALDSGCRYFTERQHAPALKNVPFADGVDPHHHLERARGSNFIHAEDNKQPISTGLNYKTDKASTVFPPRIKYTAKQDGAFHSQAASFQTNGCVKAHLIPSIDLSASVSSSAGVALVYLAVGTNSENLDNC
ncbi:hypothetical protein EST38_g12050 [Candolleomyces aberdarensis]|uniref:Uncharacterized protein n=1 Tax=Candolleomyces aberdarensis TaxID=2316362 RepID=A0A4Q2D5Z7_9AGAR|nr:hypothetical protein EST38_g12050 [Candolleomyces aberdarensis]